MRKIIFDVINHKIDKGKQVDLKGESLAISKINQTKIEYLNRSFFDNFSDNIDDIKKMFIFLKKGYLIRLIMFYFQKQVAINKLKQKHQIYLQKLKQNYDIKIQKIKARYNEKIRNFILNGKNQQEIIYKKRELIQEYNTKVQEINDYLKEKQRDYIERYNEKFEEIKNDLESPPFLENLETDLDSIEEIEYLLNTNFGRLIDKVDEEDEEIRLIFKKISFQLLFLDYLFKNRNKLGELNGLANFILQKVGKYINIEDGQLFNLLLSKFNLPKNLDFLFRNVLIFSYKQIHNSQYLQFSLANIKDKFIELYQENTYLSNEIMLKLVGYISLIIYWTNFFQGQDEINNYKDRIASIIDLILIRNNRLFIKVIDEEYKYKHFSQDDLKLLRTFLQQLYLLTIFTYIIKNRNKKELVIGKDEKLNIIIGQGEEGKILTLLSFLAKFDANATIEKKSIVNISGNIAKKMLEGEKIIIVYNKVFVDFLYIFYFVKILSDLLSEYDYKSSEYLVLNNTIVFEIEGFRNYTYCLKYDNNFIKNIYKIENNKINFIHKNSKELLGLLPNKNNRTYIDFFSKWVQFKGIRLDAKIYEYNVKINFERVLRYRRFNKSASDAYTRTFLEIARSFSYNNGILTAIETPIFYKINKHLFPVIYLDNIENKQIDENTIVGISKKILYHRVGFHTPYIVLFNKYIHKTKTFNLQVYFFNFNVKIKSGKNILKLNPVNFSILKRYILGEKITQLADKDLKQYNIASSFKKLFQRFLEENNFTLISEKRVKKTTISKRLEINSNTNDVAEDNENLSLDYIRLDYYLSAYEILGNYDASRDKFINFFNGLMRTFFLRVPYIMDWGIFKLIYKGVFRKARLYSFEKEELLEIKRSQGKYDRLSIDLKKKIDSFIRLLKIDEIGQNFFKNIVNDYLYRINLEVYPIQTWTGEILFQAIYRMLKLIDVDSYLILQFDTYITVFIALYKQKHKDKELNNEYIMKVIVSSYIKLYSIRFLLFTNILQKWYEVDKIVKLI